MKVRFSSEAKAKLRAIHTYAAEQAPRYADELIDRLTRRAELLADFPQIGRIVPKYRLKALREVLERPYRIIYRIKADEIEVITVMHYRQLLPEDLK